MEGDNGQHEDERKENLRPPKFTYHGDFGGRWLNSRLTFAHANTTFANRDDERGTMSWSETGRGEAASIARLAFISGGGQSGSRGGRSLDRGAVRLTPDRPLLG